MDERVVKVGGIVLVGLVVMSIILISISLKKLNSDEVALKYDTIAKSLSKTPSYEGLHNGPPGFAFIKFPSVFTTMEFGDLRCLNKDGVQIFLDISYQFRIRGSEVYSIAMQFQDHETFKDALESIGESALHDACSKFNTSQFQSERGAFQEEVRSRLVTKYDAVSTDVTDLQVNDIKRPRQYEDAVKSKEAAREDIVVARNERPRQLTEAETKKREAETSAGITIDRANSQARILENQATAQAQAILNEYTKEAETYKNLISSSGLNLNTEGFLAYMGVRTIEEAKNQVYISMKGPAKTSWMNQS